jgi:hypothetical protein
MAHLVKIHDYVSRYEKNLYHYQSQFIRLKKKRREEKLAAEDHEHFIEEETAVKQLPEQNKKRLFNRWFNKPKQKQNLIEEEKKEPSFPLYKVKTAREKMEEYREELFSFQLKWASSTVNELSELDPSILDHKLLRYLAEEVPDNYFVFYKPVIHYISAPVELEIIVVGPADVWLTVWLDQEGIWKEESKRFWQNSELAGKRYISPHIAMQRMEQAVSQLMLPFAGQLSLKKAVIAKDAFIDEDDDWRRTMYIDKRLFPGWLESIKREPAPVKSQQLKFVSELLSHCVTNSLYRRGEQLSESGDEEEKEGFFADPVE